MLIKFPRLIIFIISLLNIEATISSDIAFEQKLLVLAGEEYLLEIARSATQRNHGLMFRDRLEERRGMLFIYPRPGNHRIWMKNTLIPLTVVWVDEANRILGVQKLPPCADDPCPSYGVSEPSKYILELSIGEHRLEPGLSSLSNIDAFRVPLKLFHSKACHRGKCIRTILYSAP